MTISCKLRLYEQTEYLLLSVIIHRNPEKVNYISTKKKGNNSYEQNRIYHSFNGTSGDSETAGNHVRLSG